MFIGRRESNQVSSHLAELMRAQRREGEVEEEEEGICQKPLFLHPAIARPASGHTQQSVTSFRRYMSTAAAAKEAGWMSGGKGQGSAAVDPQPDGSLAALEIGLVGGGGAE